MNRDTLKLLTIFAAVAVTFTCVYAYVYAESDMDVPFTVVESQSMQHSDESQIGIIDTGDLMVVRSLDRNGDVVTYVDGYSTGESEFGEFGQVIVYYRTGNNPVIHRAILELQYSDGVWKAPSLAGYVDANGSPLWSCSSGGEAVTDCNALSGTLTLRDVGIYGKNPSVNLDTLAHRSGYLTMGDNSSNVTFDQSMGIASGPISESGIKSVAWKEVPWFGAVKLLMNGKTANLDEHAPNSLPNLALCFVAAVMVLLSLSYIGDAAHIAKVRKRTDEGDLREKDPHPSVSTGTPERAWRVGRGSSAWRACSP